MPGPDRLRAPVTLGHPPAVVGRTTRSVRAAPTRMSTSAPLSHFAHEYLDYLHEQSPTAAAAAAQGLGEAMGSAASMIGALSAAPLYSWLGAGPAFLIGAITMMGLLTSSWILDPPSTGRRR